MQNPKSQKKYIPSAEVEKIVRDFLTHVVKVEDLSAAMEYVGNRVPRGQPVPEFNASIFHTQGGPRSSEPLAHLVAPDEPFPEASSESGAFAFNFVKFLLPLQMQINTVSNYHGKFSVVVNRSQRAKLWQHSQNFLGHP